MPDFFQLGPFVLNTKLVAAFASGVLAFYGMKWILSLQKPPFFSVLPDLFLNSSWIVILIWKFGPLLEHPDLVWSSPHMILFLSGGTMYLCLGSILAILYLLWSLKRHRISIVYAADVAVYGIILFVTFYHIWVWKYGNQTNLPWGITVNHSEIQYHPLHWYTVFSGLIILSMLWRKRTKLGSGEPLRWFLLLYGASLMIIGFADHSDTATFLFSGTQWLAVIGMMTGYALPFLRILCKKGDELMTNAQDSMAQQKQERENQKKKDGNENYRSDDRKLDGPNRPSI